MFLPDTNIFILGLQGHNPEATFLKKAIQSKRLCISVVVIGEFLSKVRDENAEAFYILLNIFEVLPIDREVATVAAQLRQVGLKTKRVYLLDCFLAAQAKLNNLTLVTNNKADFPMRDIKVIVP